MAEVHRKSVLVVEPSQATRNRLLLMLRHGGFLPMDIPDPLEALRTAKNFSFDLLIVAAMLPGGNSRQFARKLEMMNPRMGTLFISNYSTEVLVESRVLFGGCEVLQSSFSEKDLMERIDAILQKRDPSLANRMAARN